LARNKVVMAEMIAMAVSGLALRKYSQHPEQRGREWEALEDRE
jgi:hypothetical protein